VPDLRERWRSGWLEPTAYDSVIEHEWLARPLGWLAWGTDTSGFYRELARLSDQPDGSSVLDIPCGGGVAFRGLRPGQRLRYVAADLSVVMLSRAQAEADRRGLGFIKFAEADVEALPFADGSFDCCVTYTGLHCFPDPPLALKELARVLRPGGELRGTSVIRNAGIRQDALVRVMQLAGVFGPCLTHNELESGLKAAELEHVRVHDDGALAYFSARRPASA
jgi:SAM-dependent methyltransferase